LECLIFLAEGRLDPRNQQRDAVPVGKPFELLQHFLGLGPFFRLHVGIAEHSPDAGMARFLIERVQLRNGFLGHPHFNVCQSELGRRPAYGG
jgi:hypothetical protein